MQSTLTDLNSNKISVPEKRANFYMMVDSLKNILQLKKILK